MCRHNMNRLAALGGDGRFERGFARDGHAVAHRVLRNSFVLMEGFSSCAIPAKWTERMNKSTGTRYVPAIRPSDRNILPCPWPTLPVDGLVAMVPLRRGGYFSSGMNFLWISGIRRLMSMPCGHLTRHSSHAVHDWARCISGRPL